MSGITRIANWILSQPFVWGGLCGLVFYALLSSGVGSTSFVERYFNSHWVSRLTTTMFFIGAASLVMRLLYIQTQRHWLGKPLFDAPPAGGQPPEEAARMLDTLGALPDGPRESLLVRRLSGALEHVRRKNGAEDLDDKLRHLEEIDLGAMSSGYALVRLVIWAVPILGFLGTVIGITIAIAELNPEYLKDSLTTVTAGLGTAFDTTALALALSMPLMFGKFAVERHEEELLNEIDSRVSAELVGRFQVYGATTDPNVASIRRMSEQVVRAVEVMAARQADLWKSTIDETNQQWSVVVEATGATLTDSISTGLRKSLADHARGLNMGVEQQLAKLNESLGVQSLTVQAAIEEQAASLSALTSGCLEQLRMSAEGHADRLTTGADEMIGGLRTGLERMAELLVEALQQHGAELTGAEQELARENRRHLSEVEAALGEAMVVAADRQEKLVGRSETVLSEMQRALVASAEATVGHQEQLIKQGDVLLKVVESTREVRRLEEALNSNLSALSRSQDLEETLLSLSASIQLLSARTGRGASLPGTDNPATHHAA
ncbi:MotA/TolQ/ExbB proton channel family protein [Pseudobythopirellula maris]|uniref:MotA/TolQ/ExbB proton channel family protein n=1 Tax=Pseudobythopirellula maris TaxID=2527991 RepID=A0A5C5ZK82_9BACT|nr:MotA/TolQ/ExbB proton channel family protein [Pseudobythopirellula maris]TWT87606.1 MotA/TolQ/ExbB proton channel family protein [Pseudobythopirellula maris]